MEAETNSKEDEVKRRQRVEKLNICGFHDISNRTTT